MVIFVGAIAEIISSWMVTVIVVLVVVLLVVVVMLLHRESTAFALQLCLSMTHAGLLKDNNKLIPVTERLLACSTSFDKCPREIHVFIMFKGCDTIIVACMRLAVADTCE